jgi:hypothetical protein
MSIFDILHRNLVVATFLTNDQPQKIRCVG